MNFIEAAVAILSSQPGKPMHVEEICRLAVERELLSRPAKDPLRSMKGRLTTELKRGEASRVDKVGPELWQLRSAPAEAAATPVPEAAPGAIAVAREKLDEVLAPPQPPRRGPLPPTAEDAQLEKMWGDELTPVPLGAAHAEYRDAQTEDEDRPMLPEIVAPRRERFPRRGERRSKRDGHRKRRSETHGETAPREEAPREASKPERVREEAPPVRKPEEAKSTKPAPREPRPEETAKPRALVSTNPLADAAVQALSTIKGGQPVQVRQLAQMMRKRKLLSEDPQQVWGLLKTALLEDERRYRRLGLRPRVVYKGRGLFAMSATQANDRLTAAETDLARAAAALISSTHAVLGKHLSALSIGQLEKVVHVFLLQRSWNEVAWIKRTDKLTSYALARPSDGSRKVLIGVRAGNEPVPRRGVGELRAGVEAKNVARGMLIAPRELTEEARSEAEKGGPPIVVLCGKAMVEEFSRAGVGVTRAYVPVDYLDDELFRELDNE